MRVLALLFCDAALPALPASPFACQPTQLRGFGIGPPRQAPKPGRGLARDLRQWTVAGQQTLRSSIVESTLHKADHPGLGEARVKELRDLHGELGELRRLISAQQVLLTQQTQAIKELNALLQSQTDKAPLNVQSPVRPFEAQLAAIGDRRYLGFYDARFHSTNGRATPKDFRVLPKRIILVRHAESEGNVDNRAYTRVPDPQVPLTAYGVRQAEAAGARLRAMMEAGGQPFRVHFYMSPYARSKQTMEALAGAFAPGQVVGAQEEVQLREQDFGNFQDAEGKEREKAERLRFGRFFYRFPNGESGADVYDRVQVFQDHMIRDINAGRFGGGTNLVLVTHGLAARIFLMRWFHWTVDQFMTVYNPPNAEPYHAGQPLVLELDTRRGDGEQLGMGAAWIHTKSLYRLTPESREAVRGCTPDMCSTANMPWDMPEEAED